MEAEIVRHRMNTCRGEAMGEMSSKPRCSSGHCVEKLPVDTGLQAGPPCDASSPSSLNQQLPVHTNCPCTVAGQGTLNADLAILFQVAVFTASINTVYSVQRSQHSQRTAPGPANNHCSCYCLVSSLSFNFHSFCADVNFSTGDKGSNSLAPGHSLAGRALALYPYE